jgi:hypothetical protein
MSDTPHNRDPADERSASNQDDKGRFVAGNRANPGGRSKVQRDVQAILERCGPKAAEKIEALIDSPDEKVSLTAARDVIDRLMGKPAQSVEVGGEAINEVLARILAGRTKEG